MNTAYLKSALLDDYCRQNACVLVLPQNSNILILTPKEMVFGGGTLWFAFASVLRAGCEQEEITYLVCNVNVLVFIAYMARKTVPTGSPCQWLCTSAVLEIKCFGVHALCIFPYLLRGCYHWYIRRPSHYLLLKSLLFKKEIIWSFRGKIT